MKEFISYAVGCMFGATRWKSLASSWPMPARLWTDYLRQVPEPSFAADDDNVIPVLDGSWFEDDIVSRRCLRVTFGDAQFER